MAEVDGSNHLTVEELGELLADTMMGEEDTRKEARLHLVQCELCGERAQILTRAGNFVFEKMMQFLKEEHASGHITSMDIAFLVDDVVSGDPTTYLDEEEMASINSHLRECRECRKRIGIGLADRILEVGVEKFFKHFGAEKKPN